MLNEQFLFDHGLAPRTLTLGSNGAIKQAARAGLGISLLSRASVEAELSAGQLGEIPLPTAHRPPLVHAPLGVGPRGPSFRRWGSSDLAPLIARSGRPSGVGGHADCSLPAASPLAPTAIAARAVTRW